MPLLSLDPPALTHAAHLLLARRAQGLTGALLPATCRPVTLEDAFAIQAAVSALGGQRTVGWKCGMPEADRRVAAPIYADGLQQGSTCPIWARDDRAMIEPELAFILRHDLPPRAAPYTQADVDAAIGTTHLALELIGSRYDDPDSAAFTDHLADGLLNQGLFIGPEVDGALAQAAAQFTLQIHGTTEATITLKGRHPNLSPRAPLYWLAEFLRSTGQGLQAGQAIITGSYAGCIALPLAQELTLRYGDLGTLSTSFIAR